MVDTDFVQSAKRLRAAMATDQGLSTLGSDPLLQKEAFDTMTAFLNRKPPVPWSQRPDAQLFEMPVGEVVRRTLETAVAILNDVSAAVAEIHVVSGTEFRRKLFTAFTAPERRMYVGIWLLVLAFVLALVDAA
jgi:hypothetical protein